MEWSLCVGRDRHGGQSGGPGREERDGNDPCRHGDRGDPVGLGLVNSLARPGGNVTGMTTLSRELSGKRLEVFREALPGVSRMGLLWHQTSRIDVLTRRETEQAAQTVGISLKAHGVDGPDDFDRALGAMVEE